MRHKNVKCLGKYLLIIFMMFFTFDNDVNAALCDNEHIRELKVLAKKIDVSYEYIDNSDKEIDDIFVINRYNVTVNLISDELYLSEDNVDYYYKDYENGIVKFSRNAGNMNLIIRSKKCAGYKIDTINIKLPHFNTYSYREECKGLEEYNLDVCNPWYQGTISDSSFKKTIDKYLYANEEEKNSLYDKIINFIKVNYIFISCGILIILVFIVGLIINRKRSVLE